MTIGEKACLIELLMKGLSDDITSASISNFNSYYVPRHCTKTAVHNRIVQLRYELSDLDKMIGGISK